MAKSRRKLKQERQNAKEGRQLLRITVIATVVLMILLFFLYSSNA